MYSRQARSGSTVNDDNFKLASESGFRGVVDENVGGFGGVDDDVGSVEAGDGGVNALGLVTCDILSYPHITLSNVVCELITESFALPKDFTFR